MMYYLVAIVREIKSQFLASTLTEAFFQHDHLKLKYKDMLSRGAAEEDYKHKMF